MNTPKHNTKNDMFVFDRDLLSVRKSRGGHMDGEYDFLHRLADDRLRDRLRDITRDFTDTHTLRITDEDLSLAAQNLDLITSTLELHTVNDLPGVLTQIKRALKPDGLFIAALFGGETLHELRDSLTAAEIKTKGGISPRVHPMADKQQMGALLQRAGFALPVIDSEIITVTYDNIFKLMHDLRGMGETNIINARDKRNTGKTFFMEAAQHYATNHADQNGRIRATFEMVFLLGWAPHDSQQKPLKPGSATVSLKDVL